MTDRDFLEVGKRSDEGGEIAKVEIVAGVDTQTGIRCAAGGIGKEAQGFAPPATSECRGVRLGIEFNPISADLSSHCDPVAGSIHEEADTTSKVVKSSDDRPKALPVMRKVPAMIARNGVGVIGHKSALGRMNAFRELHQSMERISFDVILTTREVCDNSRDFGDIIPPDMPLVGSGMNGNAGSSCLQTDSCCTDNARNIDFTRVSQRGHLIDIDTQHGPYRMLTNCLIISFFPTELGRGYTPLRITTRSGL